MQGQRIVDSRWNAARVQRSFQPLPTIRSYRVLRVDTRAIGTYGDWSHAGDATEKLTVAPPNRCALLDFPVEPLEFREHHSALQRVHTSADADARVVITFR